MRRRQIGCCRQYLPLRLRHAGPSRLTLALSGRPQAVPARGWRKITDAPDARPNQRFTGSLERVVRARLQGFAPYLFAPFVPGNATSSTITTRDASCTMTPRYGTRSRTKPPNTTYQASTHQPDRLKSCTRLIVMAKDVHRETALIAINVANAARGSREEKKPTKMPSKMNGIAK